MPFQVGKFSDLPITQLFMNQFQRNLMIEFATGMWSSEYSAQGIIIMYVLFLWLSFLLRKILMEILINVYIWCT